VPGTGLESGFQTGHTGRHPTSFPEKDCLKATKTVFGKGYPNYKKGTSMTTYPSQEASEIFPADTSLIFQVVHN
jgi:hypothetical protein